MNRKHMIPYISFYDRTSLEKLLAKMARKGWLIEGISNLCYTFRKIEPRDMHFCVSYYPRASEFDPGPGREQQRFHDFCAHTGWQLACTWHQMQVFYNEQEDPIPLETDPVLEVKTQHEACKRNFLPGLYVLLVMMILRLLPRIPKLVSDPIGQLSGGANLFVLLCSGLLALYFIGELLMYFLWYARALRKAKVGFFSPTTGSTWLQTGMLVLIGALLLLWLLESALVGEPALLLGAVLLFGGFGLLFTCVSAIRNWLKRQQMSRGENKFLTILACILLSVALMGGTVFVTVKIDDSGLLKDFRGYDPQGQSAILRQEEPPLVLEDLLQVPSDKYRSSRRCNESLLLGHLYYLQAEIYPDYDIPQMSYNVVIVKVPQLYGTCKDQFFHGSSDEWFAITGMDYAPADVAPWGAKEAYRAMSEEGVALNSYLLCYADRIVSISFTWEPTPEQMATVTEKLGP